VVQHLAIVERLQEAHRVRIAARRHDAVKQTRIVVGDQMLLHRPAGCTMPDGEHRRSELLDEVLLDLRHRLLSPATGVRFS
jgi:hypothetical protein